MLPPRSRILSVRALLTCALALCAPPLLTACDEGDAETAGQQVTDAGEKVGDALDTAAEKTGEVLGEATDDTVRATKEIAQETQSAAAKLAPSDAERIYDVLAEATEAALRPGGFDELVERLASPDRARIGDYATRDHPDLRDVQQQANAVWQKAFADDGAFDINDEAAVFGAGGAQVTLAEGSTRATLTLPGTGGAEAVTVPLVKDGGDWRIDAPDSLSGEQLKNALIDRLVAIADHNPSLPTSRPDAGRAVAARVLSAVVRPAQ